MRLISFLMGIVLTGSLYSQECIQFNLTHNGKEVSPETISYGIRDSERFLNKEGQVCFDNDQVEKIKKKYIQRIYLKFNGKVCVVNCLSLPKCLKKN